MSARDAFLPDAEQLPAIAAPHGRVHFCGEHLSTTQRGMEAASETGIMAASAILDRDHT